MNVLFIINPQSGKRRNQRALEAMIRAAGEQQSKKMTPHSSDELFFAFARASDNFSKGDFFDRSDRFLPIRTTFNDIEYFGWLRISHSMDNERLTIHDWAWNSTLGETILAGQIPKPATYAILVALGALGFVMARRRRRSGCPPIA